MTATQKHSKCVQLNIDHMNQAVGEFSQKNDDGHIPLVLIPSHRSPFSVSGWWMTIPTGCYCLVQKFGKDEGIAKPGGKVMPPYYRIAYMVNQQSCTYNAPVHRCPTSDNVRVGVDCVLVFMIRDPKAFVYKLGATHFDQLLTGAVEEGIRLLVRAQSHQTVRSLRGNRADQLLTHLNSTFEKCGVVFTNCTITGVSLPESLDKSLEHTTELQKAMQKAGREQEFQLGEIQRKCDMDLEELKRKNEQTIVGENGKKKRAELNHEQMVVKASQSMQTAMIEAQTAAQVKRMEAAAQLQRAKIDVERLTVETISKAEADAQNVRVKADIAFDKSQLNAEAERRRLIGEAEATKVDAEAEAKASQHLTFKRKHELDMREKEILLKLAQKASYNLVGESGDRLVGAVMNGRLAERPSSAGWFR